MAETRHTKVIWFQILKPAGEMTWKEIGAQLRDIRYLTFRLANLAMSEAYLDFHLYRTGRSDKFKTATIGQLSQRLREMLKQEGRDEEQLDRISPKCATPEAIHGALDRYKIKAVRSPSKWRQIVRGQASLPTFRLDMAIPIRCDRSDRPRLERMPDGNVEVDLLICRKPYPRVVLATQKLGGHAQATLDRLLENKDQSLDGYRQRVFEIKLHERSKKWRLYVTYDFPAQDRPAPKPEIIVGVDLGVSCPLYAALNNGHARLGRRQFQALAARIRSLQTQVMARRRSMQTGGQVAVSQDTARSGHGRRRKLQPIQKLQGRIDAAYTTLNHQLSAAVIDFAKNHGAGVIQIEDLDNLKEALRGTFLGSRWRYHQFQSNLEYKAKEASIELRKINPRYTSRRCSECGHINQAFDRQYRDAHRQNGRIAGFECPACGFGKEKKVDPDYNAARNIATLDIEKLIVAQSKIQGLSE